MYTFQSLIILMIDHDDGESAGNLRASLDGKLKQLFGVTLTSFMKNFYFVTDCA